MDIGVLALAAVCTYFGWRQVGEFILPLPFVVLHFFLFCNVFRVRRKPELIWSAIFLLLWVGSMVLNHFNLYRICASQIIVTIAVIFSEVKNPDYHGIFASRLNSQLENYLRGE